MNDRGYDSDLQNALQKLKIKYFSQQMTEAQVAQLHQKIEEVKKMEQNRQGKNQIVKFAAMAATAVIGIFIVLPNTSGTIAHAMEQIPVIGQLVKVVTFRNYEYETERNMAEIEVPEIQPDEKMDGQPQDSTVKENLDRTTAEINAEIQSITDNLIKEFETNLKEEQGYQDVIVKSEVLMTTPEYFTLKLICYQGAGSGYEWNYFYTIDLTTGERLQIKDIFKEGEDYITPISDEIKRQMQEQMDSDENVYYWLNDEIKEGM